MPATSPTERPTPLLVHMPQNSAMQLVLWDVDPRDWARPGVDEIVSAIREGSGPGRIILMHDGGGDRTQTVAALEQVLAELSDLGYAFKPLLCA